jgi:hypothetical protein
MSGPFIFIATNRLKPGAYESEVRRVPGLVDFIGAGEPQLLACNEYLNAEHTEVTVVQLHPDAASMEFHMGVVGERAAKAYAETLDATTQIQDFGAPKTQSCRSGCAGRCRRAAQRPRGAPRWIHADRELRGRPRGQGPPAHSDETAAATDCRSSRNAIASARPGMTLASRLASVSYASAAARAHRAKREPQLLASRARRRGAYPPRDPSSSPVGHPPMC